MSFFHRKKKEEGIVKVEAVPVVNAVVNSAIVKEAKASIELDGETHTFTPEPILKELTIDDIELARLQLQIKQIEAKQKAIKEEAERNAKAEAEKKAKEEAKKKKIEKEQKAEVERYQPMPETSPEGREMAVSLDKTRQCPKCQGKLKFGKVTTKDNIFFVQIVQCDNKHCDYKEILKERI
jgi:hypothetical protein